MEALKIELDDRVVRLPPMGYSLVGIASTIATGGLQWFEKGEPVHMEVPVHEHLGMFPLREELDEIPDPLA
jgi:hypothetical protein